MIYLTLVRLAVCEHCGGEWVLDGQEVPETCIHCGAFTWLWGRANKPSFYLRQGLTKRRRELNRGSKQRWKQERGLKQWRRFHTKEEDEAIEAAKKAAKAVEGLEKSQ